MIKQWHCARSDCYCNKSAERKKLFEELPMGMASFQMRHRFIFFAPKLCIYHLPSVNICDYDLLWLDENRYACRLCNH